MPRACGVYREREETWQLRVRRKEGKGKEGGESAKDPYEAVLGSALAHHEGEPAFPRRPALRDRGHDVSALVLVDTDECEALGRVEDAELRLHEVKLRGAGDDEGRSGGDLGDPAHRFPPHSRSRPLRLL